MFEERPLRPNDKNEFVISVGLDFADLADEVDSVGPTQVSGQLSSKEACVEKIEISTNLCTHLFSIALGNYQSCIALLT